MSLLTIYNKLSIERKMILAGCIGNDIVRCFFSDVLEEEKGLLQGLNTDVPAEEFKQKYIGAKKSIKQSKDMLQLIDSLKKQQGAT